jgi:hypothetical protein
MPSLEEFSKEDLIRTIGKLGRIIDYLVEYKFPRPAARAVISVVRVEHK